MTRTEPESIFDLPPDPALEARLDAEAEAEIEAARGVPHSIVREWLSRLSKGEKARSLA